MTRFMGELPPKSPSEAPLPPPKPKSPERQVVYEGAGEPESPSQQKEKQPELPKEPVSEKPAQEKASVSEPTTVKTSEYIIKDMAEQDALLQAVIEHTPIQTKAVQEFVASQLSSKTVEEMAIALKGAVLNKQFDSASTQEAKKFLQRLAIESGNADFLIPISGGSGSGMEFLETDDLPDLTDPNEVRQRQREHIERDAQILRDSFETNPPIDEQEWLKKLDKVAERINQGKLGDESVPPRYNEDDANFMVRKISSLRRDLKDRIEDERRIQHQAQEERQAEGTNIFLGEDEKRRLAYAPEQEFDAHFQELYSTTSFPSEAEEASQTRIGMLLKHLNDPRFERDFALVEAVRQKNKELGGALYTPDQEIDFLDGLLKDSTNRTYDSKKVVLIKDYEGLKHDDFVVKLADWKEELFEEKERIKKTVDGLKGLKFWSAHLVSGLKPESAVHAASETGDVGWAAVLQYKNGVIGEIYDLYNVKLEATFATNTRYTHKITPADLDRLDEELLHTIQTNPHFLKQLGKDAVPEWEARYYLNLAQALAVAKFKLPVAMVKAHAATKEIKDAGPEPIRGLMQRREDLGPEGEAIDMMIESGSAESYAAAMDIIYLFTIDKWNNLDPGGKKMFYESCAFIARRLGFGKIAEAEALDLLTKAKNGNEDAQKIIIGKLKSIWGGPKEKIEVLKDGQKVKRDKYDGRYEKWDSVEKWRKMDINKELTLILTAEKGFPIVSELLEAYDVDSSVWRIKEICKQLSRVFTNPESLALGYRLRKAGDEWLSSTSVKVMDAAALSEKFKDVKQELVKIGKYRPQTSALWLYQQGDEAFTRWFKSENLQQRAVDTIKTIKKESFIHAELEKRIAAEIKQKERVSGKPLTDEERAAVRAQVTTEVQAEADDVANEFLERGKAGSVLGYAALNDVVMEKFLYINAELERKGLPPIDYSSEISTESDAWIAISNVFGGTTDGMTAYISMMKALSTQMSGGGEVSVDAFQKPEYRQYFKRTQFTDDARMQQLESPKTLLLKKQEGGGTVPISSFVRPAAEWKHIRPMSFVLGLKGQDRRSSIARATGDFMVMKDIPSELLKGEGGDEEAFFKMLALVKEKVSIYSSKENAVIAFITLLSGRAIMGKTDPGLASALDVGGMISMSSELERWFGGKNKTMDIADRNAFINKGDALIGKIESYGERAADLFFDLTIELGLAKDGGFDKDGNRIRIWREDRSSPYWWSRYKLLIAGVAFLIGLEVGKSVKKVLEEEMGAKK